MLTLKFVLVVTGMVLAVVGIFTENWKLGVVGNTIALGGTLFA